MKHILNIDIEDFSPIDIKYGVFKRAEHGEIILVSYSLDNDPVVVIDIACGEELPDWFIPALSDPDYTKKAYNAPYERNYFNITLNIYSPPEQWECTLARAAMCGLPLSLDDSSKALGLTEKKDSVGKALIRYFCVPCKPTEANGHRTRNMPWHDLEKWDQFKEYNRQDVVVEQGVDKACQWYVIPPEEHLIWCLNEKKNERGVKVDMKLIDSAIEINKTYREELIEEATGLTGLSNVNSPKQLKEWLSSEMDTEVTSLNKLAVRQMLLDEEDPDVKRILQIRQLTAKSSITKYLALKYGACNDLRVRGMVQYYGANRTGREAGRGPQPQNFPRISEEFEHMLDDTRELVKNMHVDSLHFVFENLSSVLSQLLRPTFIADKGKEFIVLDFSAIEALVLACLANETWRIDFFKSGGDIYKAAGSKMFHVPIEEITKDQRQKSKVAELLCGYGGSAAAMERNNDTIEDPKKRIPVKEMPGLVKTWREVNKNIVDFWWEMDRCAKECLKTGQNVPVKNGIVFGMKQGNLLMKLPSGRCLVYHKAFLQKFYVAKVPETCVIDGKILPKVTFNEENEPQLKMVHLKLGRVFNQSHVEFDKQLKTKGAYYNYTQFNEYLKQFDMSVEKPKPAIRETVCFWGVDAIWKVIETYGPKMVENVVQGVSRDLLMNAVINVEKAGYPVILTVHDEMVVEVPKGSVSFETVKDLMLHVPGYAKDWPIKADGFTGNYYKK